MKTELRVRRRDQFRLDRRELLQARAPIHIAGPRVRRAANTNLDDAPRTPRDRIKAAQRLAEHRASPSNRSHERASISAPHNIRSSNRAGSERLIARAQTFRITRRRQAQERHVQLLHQLLHLLEMTQLFAREARQLVGERHVFGIRENQAQRGRRRLLLAVGVIDQQLPPTFAGHFVPARRRGREQHARRELRAARSRSCARSLVACNLRQQFARGGRNAATALSRAACRRSG